MAIEVPGTDHESATPRKPEDGMANPDRLFVHLGRITVFGRETLSNQNEQHAYHLAMTCLHNE